MFSVITFVLAVRSSRETTEDDPITSVFVLVEKMKLWGIAKGPYNRWEKIVQEIDDDTNTVLKGELVSRFKGRNCGLYEVVVGMPTTLAQALTYCECSLTDKSAKSEFFEYLDTFTRNKVRGVLETNLYHHLVSGGGDIQGCDRDVSGRVRCIALQDRVLHHRLT